MKLTIEMPWEKDLSVNHCRMGPRGNWHLKRHVEAWMERLTGQLFVDCSILSLTGRGRIAVAGPVEVVVSFRFPDKRKRDPHNFHYVIANAVAAGLGIDDKDIRISTGSVTVDRERPGFSITVEDRHEADK